MVKTWDDSWFEEGTRVFYLVPREQTDELLPLTVQPAPQKLVRTMVGRFELLPPEALAAVSRALTRSKVNSHEAASALTAKLGRFGPALLDIAGNQLRDAMPSALISARSTSPRLVAPHDVWLHQGHDPPQHLQRAPDR